MIRSILFTAMLGAVPAVAQDAAVDCTSPQTTYEMRICAGISLRGADEDLNDDYQRAVAYFEEFDQYLPEGAPKGLDLLRTAQRAWIVYRDAACESEAATLYGGSLQPLIVTTCHDQMTRDRSEELRFLSEQN
jgi:uncharacterized protein YecT (DUF1311 family)